MVIRGKSLPGGAKSDEADEEQRPDPKEDSLPTDLSTESDSRNLREPSQDIQTCLNTSLGSRIGNTDLTVDDGVVPIDDRRSRQVGHEDHKTSETESFSVVG